MLEQIAVGEILIVRSDRFRIYLNQKRLKPRLHRKKFQILYIQFRKIAQFLAIRTRRSVFFGKGIEETGEEMTENMSDCDKGLLKKKATP